MMMKTGGKKAGLMHLLYQCASTQRRVMATDHVIPEPPAGQHHDANYSASEHATYYLRVRGHIIGHARNHSVGKSQSCMVTSGRLFRHAPVGIC